jgi:hypothetical protein
MSRALAITITLICGFLAIAYWGDPASFGWICAMAGWSQQCFKE